MRVLVLGGTGQLGQTVMARFKRIRDAKVHTIPFIRMNQLPDPRLCEEVKKFDVIINCMAYHDVAKCELLPHLAWESNANLVMRLCATMYPHQLLVHISTDNVFSTSSTRYTAVDENRGFAPPNIYGRSKMLGEQIVMAIKPVRFIILRVSGLFGHYPCVVKKKPNFVEQVLRHDNTIMFLPENQGCTPCYAEDVADRIVRLSMSDESGVFNLAPEKLGRMSWLKFGKMINKRREVMVTIKGSIVPKGIGRLNLTTRYEFLPPLEDALDRYMKGRETIGVPIL